MLDSILSSNIRRFGHYSSFDWTGYFNREQAKWLEEKGWLIENNVDYIFSNNNDNHAIWLCFNPDKETELMLRLMT
jgi:hypothetical protein